MTPVTVHLIDASPYLFRAWFSLPKSIVDASGAPANAVYGLGSFIAKYIADTRPTHIGVAFDRNFNGSFRNEYYPPYKAHRDASPVELEAQVDPAVEMVEALGASTFIDPTYEADDLIATIMEQIADSGATFVIVSTDKDLTQLVSERTILVEPGKGLRFDAAAVVEKFGVLPEQITDFLALAGDAVDNIPGVRGIGAKTAAQLLQKYGSLEGIYAAVPAMRKGGKRAELSLAGKLEADVSMAGMSKRLATIATDAPISVTLDALRYRGLDEARIAALKERGVRFR